MKAKTGTGASEPLKEGDMGYLSDWIFYEKQDREAMERQVAEHKATEDCPEPECAVCAYRDCPHNNILHYHHDGCPSCIAEEESVGKPSIYLAGPLFTAAEYNWNAAVAAALEAMGYPVFLPQRDVIYDGPPEYMAESICAADLQGIWKSDVVVACLDGADADSGTSYECGFTAALNTLEGKKRPVLWYRTDMRSRGDVPGGKLNLMLEGGPHHEIILGFATPWTLTAEQIADRIDAAIRRYVQ